MCKLTPKRLILALLLAAVGASSAMAQDGLRSVSDTTAAPCPQPRTTMLAVKTNALFAVATIANIAVEVQLGEQWSLDVPLYYSPYNLSSRRKLRTLSVQPELRYWREAVGSGFFFGTHIHLVGFNVALNDRLRFQDNERAAWGFGLGGGYARTLGKDSPWAVEFNLGVGFLAYEYDQFYNRYNGLCYKHGRDTYWGVTRAGITFAYRWQLKHKERRQR